MALSNTCAGFLAVLDEEPAPDLMEHRLGRMAAEIEAYSDRGYGPELKALRCLIRVAQASPGQPVEVLTLFCEVVQRFHDTWPDDEPAETERRTVMEAMSARILAGIPASCERSEPGDAWHGEAQAMHRTFPDAIADGEKRIDAERTGLRAQQQAPTG